MDQVRRFFLSAVGKGTVPSVGDLKRFCDSKRISLSRVELAGLRRRFSSTAPFERIKDKPPAYLKNLFPKYGQVMIDLAFYRERWRRHNGGCIGEQYADPLARVSACQHFFLRFRLLLGG